MASKRVVKFEVKDVESLLKAFDMWTEMGSAGRKAQIEKKGEGERSFVIKKDNAWIHFYDTGAVYVSFGKYHHIRLWSGYDPVNSYTNKAKETKEYPLTWSCDKYYSMENKALVSALSKAF